MLRAHQPRGQRVVVQGRLAVRRVWRRYKEGVSGLGPVFRDHRNTKGGDRTDRGET